MVRSPFDDSRVGWIHELRREDLVIEMARYGLETEGDVAELRKRFRDYWKNPLGQPGFVDPSTGVPSADSRAAFVGGHPDQGIAYSVVVPPCKTAGALPLSRSSQWLVPPSAAQDELVSVREILGLPPNASSETVRRVLSAITRGNDSLGEVPAVNPAGTVDTSRFETGPTLSTTFATRGQFSGFGAHDELPRVPVGTHASGFQATLAPFAPVCVPGYHAPPHATANYYAPMPTSLMNPYRQGGSRTSSDTSSLCDLVRKWNLRFDGRRDPVSFLERLEELIDAYSVSPDEVVKAMPELLHGMALLWYRNNRPTLRSFAEFKCRFEDQFLPPGYRINLDEEIRKRTQGEHEPIRTYIVAISTLIRRSGSLSEQGKLDLIYCNMRPEYKLMVRRGDFYTLEGLMAKAEEYEAYVRSRQSFRPPPTPSLALVPETAYFHKRKADRAYDSAAVDHW